ncbi:hypothetical protein QE152_g37709 [Popillia japonica]|uniref:Uncharacterized protein n=1 Tax=Popillia japonica TaxID=7064 RepID=A0AAW1I8W4_POPJA
MTLISYVGKQVRRSSHVCLAGRALYGFTEEMTLISYVGKQVRRSSHVCLAGALYGFTEEMTLISYVGKQGRPGRSLQGEPSAEPSARPATSIADITGTRHVTPWMSCDWPIIETIFALLLLQKLLYYTIQ